MGRRTLALAALASVLVLTFEAAPAAAQSDGPSLLQLLPVSGSLAMGSEVAGRLGSGDYLSGGRRVQRHELQGSQGDPVIIDLISDDFDAYLIVIGPDGAEVATDDDSGGGCHSRISLFLEESGTFGVIAASLSGETGAFTLRVDSRQGPPAPGSCGEFGTDILEAASAVEPLGTLSLGDQSEVQGMLEAGGPEVEGGPAQAWLLEGEPGQTVFVDLMSRAFDTLILVVHPDGLNYSQDDDSGGACNSRVQVRLEGDPHMLLVRSFDPSATGAFTLRVSEEEGPLADGECPGP